MKYRSCEFLYHLEGTFYRIKVRNTDDWVVFDNKDWFIRAKDTFWVYEDGCVRTMRGQPLEDFLQLSRGAESHPLDFRSVWFFN